MNHSTGIHTREVTDKVVGEVRAIKRAISDRHGNDVDRLLASLMAQERSSGIGQTSQNARESQVSNSEATQAP